MWNSYPNHQTSLWSETVNNLCIITSRYVVITCLCVKQRFDFISYNNVLPPELLLWPYFQPLIIYMYLQLTPCYPAISV